MIENHPSQLFSPVALSIAGSDSGGGAGIQADLRAFAFFGVFGATAITAITAQNPRGVSGVQPASDDILARQIRAVADAFAVGAIKTGMLFSAELVGVVADSLALFPGVPLVLDPVMVATSGARLLQADACTAMIRRLLPLATLITPNLPEAEMLAGRTIANEADMLSVARQLRDRHGCGVLLKGGHGHDDQAVDILATTDEGEWRLLAPRAAAKATHGTGCSLSAACAAVLAGGGNHSLREATLKAKAYVLASLRNCLPVGPSLWAMGPATRLPLEDIICLDCT